MRWEFTPDEFMHVWKETGRDRYPFPLAVRASVRWEDEYQRIVAAAAAKYPRDLDPDLSAALRVAADPQSTLTLSGTRRRRIRIYGAVDTTIGVTLVQYPGVTEEFGGNVVLEVGPAGLVANIILQILGEQPKGSHPPLVESIDTLRDTYEMWTGSKPRPADRMRRLLSAPRTSSGYLEARHALRSDRPFPPRYLSWFDVADDGRYIHVHRYRDFHIAPLSHAQLRQELHRLLDPG